MSPFQKATPEVAVMDAEAMMSVWKERFPDEDLSNFTTDEFYTYLSNHEALKNQVGNLTSRAALVRQVTIL